MIVFRLTRSPRLHHAGVRSASKGATKEVAVNVYLWPIEFAFCAQLAKEHGNKYLAKEFPKLSYIICATRC